MTIATSWRASNYLRSNRDKLLKKQPTQVLCNLLWHGVECEKFSNTTGIMKKYQANKIESRLVTSNQYQSKPSHPIIQFMQLEPRKSFIVDSRWSGKKEPCAPYMLTWAAKRLTLSKWLDAHSYLFLYDCP